MLNTYRRGLFYEWLASIFLKLKLYKILYKRYKTPVGEIDLICRKKDTIIFVEVKYRTRLFEEDNVVQNKQIYRIRNAAAFFIARNSFYNSFNLRFDLLIINNRLSIKHYQNVW